VPWLEYAVGVGGEVMLVGAQERLHVILMYLDDQHEEVWSTVGAGQADLADHDFVWFVRRKAQRPRLREPRLYV